MNTGATLRYLSLEWLDALSAVVAADASMAELASMHSVGITQQIDDGPEGTVIYHLQAAEGAASFGPGPADPEDIRLREDWATAVAVATGEMHAQEAFITGKILLTGDQSKLIEAQPVFARLAEVFRAVGERTEYR